MNQKFLTLIIIGISLAITFVIVGIFSAYKYYPQLIGLEQTDTDTLEIDTMYFEPIIAITKQQLEDFQIELLSMDKINHEKDSIFAIKENLADSLGDLQKHILILLDSMKYIESGLTASNTYSKALNDTIRKVQQNYKTELKQKNIALKNIEKQKNEFDLKVKTISKDNLLGFAKIYNKTKATSVAKILENLSDRDAALILKNMQAKKAGKVLEVMKPEKAKTIMEKGIYE